MFKYYSLFVVVSTVISQNNIMHMNCIFKAKFWVELKLKIFLIMVRIVCLAITHQYWLIKTANLVWR